MPALGQVTKRQAEILLRRGNARVADDQAPPASRSSKETRRSGFFEAERTGSARSSADERHNLLALECLRSTDGLCIGRIARSVERFVYAPRVRRGEV
jgi:hypothetical protein